MLSTPEPLRENDQNLNEPDAAKVIRHLAHELRQPLSTLDSLAFYLDIVLPESDERCREQVEKIQALVRQANEIIDDAVYFTQASTPNPSVVVLDELITRKIADYNSIQDLNIQVEESSQPCVAWVDPTQLGHAFSAALNIFRRITFHGSPISVRSEETDGKAEVRITSTASSRQVEQLRQFNNIPEPAFSLTDGWLSIASMHRVIQANEGDLEIESGPDQQVALCFRFPIPC